MINLEWVSDYIDISDLTPKELAKKVTESDINVEKVITNHIDNLVIGEVVECVNHPDSDHLHICKVDIGSEVLQIVCGAPNVRVGLKAIVALVGAVLPGDFEIKKSKIRGVESNGMLCALYELGLEDKNDETYSKGIYEGASNLKVGEDALKALDLESTVLELDIHKHRNNDCYYHIGFAYIVSAILNRKVTLPDISFKEITDSVDKHFSLEVATNKCSYYLAKMVKNVTIKESPSFIKKRLIAAGMRPINNVVDISNYVMLEYGQPMHAYDLDHVEGKKIIVRNAEKDEKLETLDDQPRILGESMIVIADEKRAIGVAGVMGGANSEVCDDTTTVLFESACFNAAAVRKGAKALGMRTDASALFEKGLDSENCLPAINRACELMVQLGAGEVVGGIIDEYPIKKQQLVLDFEPEKMNAFLGMDIPCDEMVEMLARLDFKVENDKVYVPTYRGDIEGMADISEEVARIYGYDRIPTTLMKGEMVAGGKTDKQKLRDTVRNCLSANGLYEIITYSFIDPKENAMVRIPEDDSRSNFVRITNPLGAENSVMRTDMTSSLLKTLRTNYTRRNAQAALFELGTIFTPIEGEQLPRETQQIAVGMYGEYDFYSIKGVIEALFEKVGIYDCIYVACKDNPTYHGGRCAEIMSGDKKLGIIGQIHPSVSAEFKIDTDVYAAIIDFEVLSELADMQRHYVPLPKFPAVTRDIAVTLDKDVEVGEIVKIIKANRKGIIESYNLFDIYEGIQVGKGKKSVAYSLTFRSADKTLTDDDVNPIVNTILKQLEEKLGAQLR